MAVLNPVECHDCGNKKDNDKKIKLSEKSVFGVSKLAEAFHIYKIIRRVQKNTQEKK